MCIIDGQLRPVMPRDRGIRVDVTVATIEAMKMEAAITAPRAGTVWRVAVSTVAQVEGNDLLIVIG